mgnify:CR=1 FL=1
MSEVFIVVGLILLAGMVPILLVVFLTMRALKKSFNQIEEHIDTRFNSFEESMERIDDIIAKREESISKTVAKIKRK